MSHGGRTVRVHTTPQRIRKTRRKGIHSLRRFTQIEGIAGHREFWRAITALPFRTLSATRQPMCPESSHLVALLKAGQIPYAFAGEHRRVAIDDLLEYMAKRDKERRDALNRMTRVVDAADLYDSLT